MTRRRSPRLQQRLGVARPSPEQVAKYPVVYCVFDLLELDGEDLTGRPFVERRAQLIKDNPIQLGTAAHRSLERRLRGQVRRGLPDPAGRGSSPSTADAPYVAGRSKDWLKLKCVWEQEFVVGGYTDPAGSRTDFGALLVGYYEQGSLRYAGKVGTGYTGATLHELGIRLRKLETTKPPFVDTRPIPRGRALDAAQARRSDRFCRMDERRSATAAALSRAPGRQEPGRRRPRAPRVTWEAVPWQQNQRIVSPAIEEFGCCVDG